MFTHMDQGLVDMQLVELMTEVLETGLMPMATERKMQALLKSKTMNEVEMQMIDQLIDALTAGKIQAIASVGHDLH